MVQDEVLEQVEKEYKRWRGYAKRSGKSPTSKRRILGGVNCTDIPAPSAKKVYAPPPSIEAEEAAEGKLCEWLFERDLQYAAIVPFEFMLFIQEKLDFYNFEQVIDGKVYGRVPPARKQTTPTALWGSIFFTVISCVYIAESFEAQAFYVIAVALVIVNTIFSTASAKACEKGDAKKSEVFAKLEAATSLVALVRYLINSRNSQGKLKRIAWPTLTDKPYNDKIREGVTPAELAAEGIGHIPIALPPAYEYIKKRLCAADDNGLLLSLLVAEEGFSIDGISPHADPMPYTRAVMDGYDFAIIWGQYGEIEDEKFALKLMKEYLRWRHEEYAS